MKLFSKAKIQARRKDRQRTAERCIGSSVFPNPAQLLLLGLTGSLWLMSTPTLAREKQGSPPTKAEVAEKKVDLKELRGQIETLRKGMATSEGKRADSAKQLKEVEQEISHTQRDMQNLANQRGKLQATLKDLDSQSRALESRLHQQQEQLEDLVYRQYLKGNPDALRLLLNGDEPSQVARDLYYLAAIGRARSQLLHESESTLQRQQELASEIRERAEEMTAIESREKEQHGKLVAQREQRKTMLERISAQISEQRRTLGNLQRDEKQLSQLIERLARIIAAKPVPRREVQSKSSPQTSKRSPSEQAMVTEIRNESTPAAAPAGSFARLKGELRLPAQGLVSNRFGGARQEGGTWKGLFIRANPSSEVKAIAGGRVVFAEWMRGFGNLMIVDHGSSYLSIYGNNDALLKQVGDMLRGGDTIAAVGNSGGNPESGLYFELRHQGQPLDPLKWVNLK